MTFNEALFRSLHEDLEICRDYIRQVAHGMLKGGISKYPIFVAQRSFPDLDLGLPLINREEFDIQWSFSVSHLEDFVVKKVVPQDKVDLFMETYKDPQEFMCVFVWEEGAMSFVFMPYVRKQQDPDTERKENLN